ncbi:putative membrane protein, partial [Chlamydia psittaci 06-1683]
MFLIVTSNTCYAVFFIIYKSQLV